MIPQPHDALFRAVFSEPENASGELQSVLPPALVARLDWATLRHEPGSFVDREFVGRHTDLLFSIALRHAPGKRAKRAFVYALMEHQSEPDRFMVLRLLGYDVRIWEKFLKDHPDAKYLPPIIPIVLHHGEHGWYEPVRFSEILAIEPEDHAELSEFVPDFRFVLDDLIRVGDEELRDRTMATAYARLALFFLKHSRRGEALLQSLHLFGALLRELWRVPRGAADLEALLRYYVIVNEGPPEPLRKALVAAAGPEGKEMGLTIAECWIAEGLVKGKAESLLDVLETRGFRVSTEQRARILACMDVNQLSHWLKVAVTAPSADAIFA